MIILLQTLRFILGSLFEEALSDNSSQQEEQGKAKKWKDKMDTGRQGGQKGPATHANIPCTVYIHTHTHKHYMHSCMYTCIIHTHTCLDSLLKEKRLIDYWWKCLAKRRWAWRRFSLLEHMCVSLPELRPVLWTVSDWKHLHVNAHNCECM